MTDAVRWGLLSTAAINDCVLEGCAGSELVEFVAVASRSAEKARAWAQARGIPRAHGSYQELLDDPAVEAVYVSLPNSMHVEWSVRALEAGKHVLCEKPLSPDVRKVAEAFDASDRCGLLLAEAFMYRFHPQTARIRELIAEGRIGRVRFVRSAHTFAMPDPDGDVRTSPELEGGALLDVGCYCVSVFRLLAGEPARVLGHAVRGSTGVDLEFFGTLVGADGAVGQFDCAMDLPLRNGLEVVGSEGTLLVPDPWHCPDEPFELRVGDRREQVRVPALDPYRAELEALSRAIRDGDALEFGRADALAQARIMAALFASADAGIAVDVPSPAGAEGPR
jgi:D-xylose 1-dehydrogenase (NADP+, D-xylono-1,5-lactone-forming)